MQVHLAVATPAEQDQMAQAARQIAVYTARIECERRKLRTLENKAHACDAKVRGAAVKITERLVVDCAFTCCS